MPASAPAPEATPKASARGKDIIAVVTPPNRSPLKDACLNLLNVIILLTITIKELTAFY
ncbi:hypothetical protein PPEP_a2890 [Pseudoalteromonas peptidolytica F12-50-A1]|uniref:Uncharacterized protein n=1 Tax=Pseudoalteromonas peptidolytica F12-50-A1 TaxID=1315280 RepID=A0A8I0T3W5_9GAMM|nr:hypothetical protein [Pseudoalteromonas peptidolytica F12-50-A1]